MKTDERERVIKMGLFVPIWMTNNRRREKRAVRYLKKHHSKFSQAELHWMARELPLSEVRREALIHINDDDILVSIVQDETVQEMYRVIAAKRIQSPEKNNLLDKNVYTSKIKNALYESRKLMVDRLLYQLEYGSANIELAEKIIRLSTSWDTAERAYSYLPNGYSKKRLGEIDEHLFLLGYHDIYTMNKITKEESE